MPRPPRLHIPGGCYHVMLRGNHREPLFGSVADRQVLNDIVIDVLGRFDTRIHAFCWMSNHLHALLQITLSRRTWSPILPSICGPAIGLTSVPRPFPG